MTMTEGAEPRARNEYGVYHVPEGLERRPASKAVLSGKVYEADTIAFMRAHVGTGDIIHAGTFFGDFLPGLSSAMAPDARIWAFEPSPGNHAAAEQTIALNGLTNVTLANAALSNTDGHLYFKTAKPDGQSLGGVSHIVEAMGDGVEEVKAVMLDYAVPRDRHVSILQLDVEGHEKPALRGAYHIICRCKPILILEYFDSAMWINKTFRGLGYALRGKLHGNFVFAPPGVETQF